MTEESPAATLESRDDLAGDEDTKLFSYWDQQEKIADKEERDWIKRSRKIVKRYRDERGRAQDNIYRYNMFWSNVQTIAPAVYNQTPKPDIERRFKDKDPVARLSAIILERCVSFVLSTHDFDGQVESSVEDLLLPGRGVARVLYLPKFEWIEEPGEQADIDAGEGQEDEEKPKKTRRLVSETTEIRHVYWEDYREGPARSWIQVPWVRYRAYLTKDELIERFGKEKADKVTLDVTPKGSSDENAKDLPPPDAYKKAEVHEIWDKSRQEVIWRAPGTSGLILDKMDDPLSLPDFFPNPDPLLATTTTDKRIPVPDYIEYQDQLREIDTLSMRIDRLTKALKVAGVYPAAAKSELQQLVQEGTENKLIPVEDWAALGEKMTKDGLIIWLPIDQIIKVVVSLYDARDKSKQALYEITGISDIIRGATDPNETLGAQQMKGRFSSRRLSKRQKRVAKFSRDCIRLLASVIAAHFQPDTISKMSGYPQLDPMPPQPQMQMTGLSGPDPAYQQWQQASQQVQASNDQKKQEFLAAVQLLKEDECTNFRIDIEADSTVQADEIEEQQSRTGFLEKIVPLMENVMPMARGNPPVAAFAKEIVLFAVRGFRVGRTLEETIEKAFDALAQAPPTPDPGAAKTQAVEAKAKAEVEVAQIKAQADTADTMTRASTEREKNQVQVAESIAHEGLERQRLAVEAENAETRAAQAERHETVRLVTGRR